MMKKVFHIICHFDQGGAEKVAASISVSPNEKYEYHIVEVSRGCGNFSEKYVADLRNQGIYCHRSHFKNMKLGILLFPFWFVVIFRKYNPDVIHSHADGADLSVYLFYTMFRLFCKNVKFIRTIHNTVLWDIWERVGNVVERFFIKRKTNIAISIPEQMNFRKKYGEIPPII